MPKLVTSKPKPPCGKKDCTSCAVADTSLYLRNYDWIEYELKRKDEYFYTIGRFSFLTESPNISEKVEYVSSIPIVRKHAVAYEGYKEKNQTKAENMRLKGNDAFKANDLQTALSCYNFSIHHAVNGTKELGLAYANRSSIMMKWRKYEICLRDIKFAFANKYPEDMQYKLLEREVYCYRCLKDWNQLVKCYEELSISITKSNLKDDDKTEKQVEIESSVNIIKMKLNVGNYEQSDDEIPGKLCIPSITGEASVIYPCASDAFDLSYSKEKGRFAVAARDIEVGDVILVEKPYVCMTVDEKRTRYCCYCCLPVFHGIPCTQCSGMTFCGETCRDEAWNLFHKTECKFDTFLEEISFPDPRIALRIILKIGLQKLLAYDKAKSNLLQTDTAYKGHGRDMVYRSDDYHAIYNLTDWQRQKSSGELFKRMTGAMMILNILDQTGFFNEIVDSKLRTEARMIVGAHVYHHFHVLMTNCFMVMNYSGTMYTMKMNQMADTPGIEGKSYGGMETPGLALCATLSCINHSCAPSAKAMPYGNTAVLRAVKPIKKGEEITRCYTDEYFERPKKERQATLHGIHNFTCDCIACVDDWPLCEKDLGLLLTDGYAPKFHCTKCDTLLSFNSGHCDSCKCGELYVYELMKEKAMAYGDHLSKYDLHSALEPECNRNLAHLSEVLKFIIDYVRLPSMHYTVCQGIIVTTFMKLANDYTASSSSTK